MVHNSGRYTQSLTNHQRYITSSKISVHVRFRELCALSYSGIKNNQQIAFSTLPPRYDALSLIQEVHQLYINEICLTSYNFTHLTVQEYLVAVHLSHLSPDTRTSIYLEITYQKYLEHYSLHTDTDFGHFNMVFKFLSGVIMMISISPYITNQMLAVRVKQRIFNQLYKHKSMRELPKL